MLLKRVYFHARKRSHYSNTILEMCLLDVNWALQHTNPTREYCHNSSNKPSFAYHVEEFRERAFVKRCCSLGGDIIQTLTDLILI